MDIFPPLNPIFYTWQRAETLTDGVPTDEGLGGRRGLAQAQSIVGPHPELVLHSLPQLLDAIARVWDGLLVDWQPWPPADVQALQLVASDGRSAIGLWGTPWEVHKVGAQLLDHWCCSGGFGFFCKGGGGGGGGEGGQNGGRLVAEVWHCGGLAVDLIAKFWPGGLWRIKLLTD